MGCCFRGSRTQPPMETSFQAYSSAPPPPRNLRQEILFQIPGCRVHLMDDGEALELAQGHFEIVRIVDDNESLATVVRVGGGDLQWPLTKDEPVVKLTALNYLFSLAVKDGEPLSYGVTFSEQSLGSLGFLDSFLKDHACFTGLKSSSRKNDLDWKEFAPKVDDYNHFLAKAIAGGTGQIVRGIFMCSNAYTNQIQKGGETIVRSAEEKNGVMRRESGGYSSSGSTNRNQMNKNLKRARNVSKMTEKLSKSLLNGVGIVSGSVMGPVVRSKSGQAFLRMLPGEVLLASLDAVNKVLDAAEAAEKQTFVATSQAVTRSVTNRFGEDAGEATEHVLATAGHAANTAWNVFKIRKAINPASSAKTGVLKNAMKNRSFKY
ncbi:senescence/dehydration-associated protein At4g35985, chloroplastic-like [Prosopis cineraria]|uniref:senescence/dehydration-associated protein At4g35985, chloroplastic-like n=1 Tax=Prosopis cineraria TaxID=364024 RepID=UPI00240EBF8C|nr:senescence/dehydration-associated protein At4g35985, chloroplastic-like [Prosopis cineraria]